MRRGALACVLFLAGCSPLARELGDRGQFLLKNGRVAAARRWLELALMLDPANPETLAARAMCRNDAGDWAGAIADADRALALGVEGWHRDQSRRVRGWGRGQQGDLMGALTDYDEGSLGAPRDWSLAVERASLYMDVLGLPDASLHDAERALALTLETSARPDAAGRYDLDALLALPRASAPPPSWKGAVSRAMFVLARGYMTAGQPARARKVLERAFRLQPEIEVHRSSLVAEVPRPEPRLTPAQRRRAALRYLMMARPASDQESVPDLVLTLQDLNRAVLLAPDLPEAGAALDRVRRRMESRGLIRR